ncbi:hypothetical protein [Prosthecomicrobium sp. N25]|uniref:hypothetical protein n=1 Tax=Prosthecomicrobium sp. N25 TaxID=3129254 RepID=UPI00307757C0
MRKSVCVALLALAIPADADAAGRPSFDCMTASTAREVAVCAVNRLAAADRSMASAFRAARRRFEGAGLQALVEDQQAFLRDIDYGFERDVWNKDEVTRIQETVDRLVREKDRSLDELATQIEDRTRFLSRAGSASGGFGGFWSNHEATLLLRPIRSNVWEAEFTIDTYGFAKDHCYFRATFRKQGEVLVTEEAIGLDERSGGDVRLTLTLQDGLLAMSQGPGEGRACSRFGDLQLKLFKTATP